MTQFAHKQLPAAEELDPLDMALKETSGGHSGGGAPKQSALAKVHQIFRGKYHWLIILGLVLGGVGGYLGYKRGHLTYLSTGTVRVKINIPKVVGPGDGTGYLAGFDEFVSEQMSALQSKNVLEKAVKNPQWAGLVQIEDENLAELDLLRRLKVTQNGELVKVESSDGDPRMATAAVNTVMSAYKELYVLVDPETSDPVIMSLKTVDKQLELDRDAAKKGLAELVAKLGTDQLDAECASIQDQVTTLEKSIQALRRDIAIAAIELKRPPLEGISDEYLSLIDPTLISLTQDLHAAQLRLNLVEKGSNSSSPTLLRDARGVVENIKELLQGRLDQIHDLADHGIMIPGLPKRTTQRDVDEKQAELDLLVPEAVALRKQWVSTNQQNIDLKALKEQLAEVQKKLNDNEQHIEEQRLNNPNPRRLEVLSEGEYPLAPDKDSRPKLAAVGSAGGLFLATMLVGLMGMMNRKLRAPHDLQVRMEAKTVLGIIPSLEEGPDFSQRAALASECVHRSRTMLEIWARGNKKMVIGVTSPTHGSGNTSVAMSLGVSFAAAGLKTLLVDCDFVTTGLTPRLQTHVRRELSTVLKREGLISETQLNHAMRVAAAETVNGALGSRSIGDVCVELGYITQAELDAAVAVQMKESIGILDALQGEDLRSCVGKTGIRNLSLLPRANATPAHAAKLSSQSLRAVLDEAREHYDTIIIDTSAILSGLEASIVASAVDGMVVTVARGEERSKLQKTLTRLKSLECPVAGIIFNHVLPGDMPTPAPLEGASVDHDALMRDQLELDLSGRLAELGPLASSVVARVPISDRGTELG